MKLGAQLWPQNTRWESIRDAAKHVDALGFDGVWTWDHFYALSGESERPNFSAPEILSALATQTKRVTLGPLVAGITYRNPAILANMFATIDHISGGRAVAGVGAAWHVQEHKAFGIDLGTPGERSRRFAEGTKVLRALLDGERVTYSGRYYKMKDAVLNTPPVQKRLPIMVGGGGEQRTLRTTARYADMWHGFGPPEQVAHKVEVLRKHLAEAGRPLDAVEPFGGQWICVRDDPEEARQVLDEIKTHHPGWAGPQAFIGNADQVAARLKSYWDVGIRGYIIGFAEPFDLETMERLAKDVRPRLERLIGKAAA